MKQQLGKWKQYLLLRQNRLTANSIPRTALYNMTNLKDFVNSFDYAYVKHDTTGQGRAIYKVYQLQDGRYCYDGYSIQGVAISKCVKALENFHQMLHPFERMGRMGNYIVQEGVLSFTPQGLPVSLRVHMQLLKKKWLVGGINANIGTEQNLENGILNSHRGSAIITVDELLSSHWQMDETEKKRLIKEIGKVATSAAKVIAEHVPSREYGIDLGLNAELKPIIFEVNNTPGIGGFAKLEDKSIWRKIIENRKLQNGE
ncbi:YheC/D like ATP-grasp [Psychrobacillus sp. OK028]|uniref:YheC/YheD family protein n=1 Tax=Psychrobacillus sp. OK028 TaxID=1884359 RepID=UPI000888EBBC|nr:YheC/YheD family protein [Psychrobacillus sp. OK028]SDN62453.1 YheC/D like ATP-grasp [Psychrobacillus sp. OK028]